MGWIVVVFALSFLAARRNRCSVEAAFLAAVTFATSGAVLAFTGQVPRGGGLAGAIAESAIPISDRWIVAGAGVIFAGLLVAYRRATRSEVVEAAPDSRDAPVSASVSVWLPGAIGLGLSFTGILLLIATRGGVPNALGGIGWTGAVFALIAALEPGNRGQDKRVALVALPVLLLVGVALPWSATIAVATAWLVSGLAATGLDACQLGARAFGAASRPARAAAFCILLPAVIVTAIERGPAPLVEPLTERRNGAPAEDELFRLACMPSAVTPADGEAWVEGWLYPAARIVSARLQLSAIDAQGERLSDVATRSIPLTFSDAPSVEVTASGARREQQALADAPDQARWFRASPPAPGLAKGHWHTTIDFYVESEEAPVASRFVTVITVRPDPLLAGMRVALLALLLALLAMPPRAPYATRCVVLCAVVLAAVSALAGTGHG